MIKLPHLQVYADSARFRFSIVFQEIRLSIGGFSVRTATDKYYVCASAAIG
jgi:hypothetical protein